jgi:branched-subunit amino acid aminotransferase/4-amino-4-deoxychorismate lyase
MAGIAWINGKLLPPEEAAISPLDSGFLYGEGLFETMRAYSGKAFRLPQHLDRLLAGAAEFDFVPPDRASITKAIADALAASELPDASVRLTLTPGIAGASSPTLVVLVRPLALPPPERYEQGCITISVPAAHVGGTPLRRVKSLNYLDKLLAQRAAAKQGAHEAILVDPDGCVVEGAMRNIFAVIRGELVTPPLSRGFLPGITRAAVLQIAEKESIPHAERDLPLTDLRTAHEAFLTSSLAEILPVASLDGNPIQAPGPLTRRLTAAYRSLTSIETA